MELIVPQSIKEMERLAMEDPVWYATLKEEWYREVAAEEESGGKVVSFLQYRLFGRTWMKWIWLRKAGLK